MLPLGKRRRQAKGAGQLSGSCTFRIGPQPLCIASFVKITSSKGENNPGSLFFSGLKNDTVQLKKGDADSEASPFVTVNKWMIANDAAGIQGSQLEQVGRAISEVLEWTREG